MVHIIRSCWIRLLRLISRLFDHHQERAAEEEADHQRREEQELGVAVQVVEMRWLSEGWDVWAKDHKWEERLSLFFADMLVSRDMSVCMIWPQRYTYQNAVYLWILTDSIAEPQHHRSDWLSHPQSVIFDGSRPSHHWSTASSDICGHKSVLQDTDFPISICILNLICKLCFEEHLSHFLWSWRFATANPSS